jgi:UDP-2-acetamido-2,6-beta-L-arabino-hexul-4-ose reductase
MPDRQVLVTGAHGFIGSNLSLRLHELGYSVDAFDVEDDVATLDERVRRADAVVHLAGVNRPQDLREFSAGNAGLTTMVCAAIAEAGRPTPLVMASSAYAARADDPSLGDLHRAYGQSKRDAERAAEELAKHPGTSVCIYRLPSVFGKWCRPNYNSVVATFCQNAAQGLPLEVRDPAALLTLVYIDDVVESFVQALWAPASGVMYAAVTPEYQVTLGELARLIGRFRDSRSDLTVEHVGGGFARALWATYLSYLPTSAFSYCVPTHGDARGTFTELVKTIDAGQFSMFTAHPGITRGGHYHHSKTEKFVVVRGRARFRFQQAVTGALHEIETSGTVPEVVETVPGWAHDITNIGDEELIVLLWANERFDPARPDTIPAPLGAPSGR